MEDRPAGSSRCVQDPDDVAGCRDTLRPRAVCYLEFGVERRARVRPVLDDQFGHRVRLVGHRVRFVGHQVVKMKRQNASGSGRESFFASRIADTFVVAFSQDGQRADGIGRAFRNRITAKI